MLKMTKIIINAYWIVDSTYTVSYPDRSTFCNMSTDRPSRATLDNWKGGGGYTKNRNITVYYLNKRSVKMIYDFIFMHFLLSKIKNVFV